MPLTAQNITDVDRQQVLKRLGYSNDHPPSARVEALAQEYISKLFYLLEPSYSYVIKDITSVRESLIIVEDSISLRSKVLSRLLAQCEKAGLLVVTIGSRLEKTVSKLSRGHRMVEATILDAIGSSAAESLADTVQDIIRKQAHAYGLGTSLRFSPGYCDWQITQQRALFQALGGDTAGVHLTDRYLMIPQKSISGIIGIGPRQIVENFHPCSTCLNPSCRERR